MIRSRASSPEQEQTFRRSRGYAPEPIALAHAFPVPLLACGGHLKNTFCLGKDRHAFLSHHIGDLENLETLTSFKEGIEHFKRLFDIAPEVVAYDLHPEYLATKYALESDIPRKLACSITTRMAQRNCAGRAWAKRSSSQQGVAATDGTGSGPMARSGAARFWPLICLNFERLAYLDYVPLPGGEQAVRQPWRMAAVYLAQAYGDGFLDLDIPFVHQLDRATWRTLAQMSVRQAE